MGCHAKGLLQLGDFCRGKAALAEKINLMMSDVIPDPYNFTNSDVLQIIMHRAHVYTLRCGVYKYVCRGQCHIKRVAG